MATRYYTAVFERAGSGGYGVFFPDLAGCTSHCNAKGSLRCHGAQPSQTHRGL